MYYIDRTHGSMCDERQKAMETQRMKEAREHLTEEVVELLRMAPGDGARWTGTSIDLMEIIHIAYTQGTICDDTGNAYTFARLVTRACLILHMKEPRNPRSSAYKAAQSKGVRRRPFIERYADMLFGMKTDRPLRSLVRTDNQSRPTSGR